MCARHSTIRHLSIRWRCNLFVSAMCVQSMNSIWLYVGVDACVLCDVLRSRWILRHQQWPHSCLSPARYSKCNGSNFFAAEKKSVARLISACRMFAYSFVFIFCCFFICVLLVTTSLMIALIAAIMEWFGCFNFWIWPSQRSTRPPPTHTHTRPWHIIIIIVGRDVRQGQGAGKR